MAEPSELSALSYLGCLRGLAACLWADLSEFIRANLRLSTHRVALKKVL